MAARGGHDDRRHYGVLADPSASASERMRAADRLASIDKSFTEGEAHASAYLQRVYERTIAARHDEQHLEAADEAGAE